MDIVFYVRVIYQGVLNYIKYNKLLMHMLLALVETYSRSFKFVQVIFRVRLVCLIELLTINAFKVSIFYQHILQYLSKSDLIGGLKKWLHNYVM